MIDQVKLYPVWSNFIYFITAIYAITLSYVSFCLKYKLKFTLFAVYGIILILTGLFSILYHMNTPSWTGNPDTKNTEKYKKYLLLDQGFALTLLIYSLLFLFGILGRRIYLIRHNFLKLFVKTFQDIPRDVNLYLSILFFVLSFIFYGMGTTHVKLTEDCKKDVCVGTNLDSYDIFHSNWHIFTSIALIFWISFLNNIY